VNVIRRFEGRGIRVWGARTLSSASEWKYVNVRRLLMFLEQSIYEGTQWVVFEPNDERLWTRVTDTIRLFLFSQWRDGALVGTTERDAFFVRCDRTTMTQDDILNGRLICEIGVAPVRPAEFVIFRLFQHTLEAQH
jgi:phage tail sheath protein FI